MSVPMTRTLPDLSKMEPLDGTNYKRWSQKLLIFFEQLDVDYVLFQNPPETPAEASILAITTADATTIGTTKSEDEAKHKYDRDNKTECQRYLDYIGNTLWRCRCWEKEVIVGKWLQFQMIDEKPIMDQIHEYENLVADVLSEAQEKGSDSARIDRHMRTEEANRLKDKETSLSSLSIKANLVESAGSKDRFYQNKGKKFQKNNHHKSFKATDEANLVENKEDWILDTGASRHFCSNKALFHELLETTDGECVFMGNSTTSGVLGKGKILLKLTSGKTLALIDVLYVPSLRRNLVSGSLLNKAGLKIVLESDKVIITKNNDFVGKGYLSDGLFVLNTVPVMFNKNSSIMLT
ncbi:UNVERIFIED_CONTAM: hypothetical protein Sangu_2771500 [Sesamum angustifolium]|uniref:Retrovirus-related Pol polyprotein from transposon TNT 1-94-like beta-barrel domain-containing protein n=1 Tax=Sesamum angustifolium TaxID=2727405 RepID=A0AAW2IU32_9LAMI